MTSDISTQGDFDCSESIAPDLMKADGLLIQSPKVSLGYYVLNDGSQALHRRFFPSKVGGKPAWLDPEHLPDGDKDLTCQKCGTPMTFLLQVYSARDTPFDAFHRTIYIFVCCNCTDEFIALRCQLPRKNAYYPDVPADPVKDTDPKDKCLIERCCPICGIPIEMPKTPSANPPFSDSKSSIYPIPHRRCAQAQKDQMLLTTFPEGELEIDDEDDASTGSFGAAGVLDDCKASDSDTDSDHGSDDAAVVASDLPHADCKLDRFAHEKALLEVYRRKEEEDPDNVLDESEQEAFETFQAERTPVDPLFSAFLKYMRKYPNHVIRYAASGNVAPMWTSERQRPTPSQFQKSITSCAHCSGPMRFEFQVQPTLISTLRSDALSFGVLCIYTCANSCSPSCGTHSSASTYLREVVVRQHEPFYANE